jgi:proteasome lid subunit RPN8/RPN11
MLKIKKSVLDAIVAHSKSLVPVEACGYLAGNDNEITKEYILTNVDNSPEHFSFDPKEQFDTIRKAREAGLEILGNFHSHPVTPARPSAEDIRLAFDPDIHYFIVSLAEEEAVVRSFRISGTSVEREELEVN